MLYFLANINSPNIQQKCAAEWNALDPNEKEQYFQAADETNQYHMLNKTILIENHNKRKVELNKQIRELRKIVIMVKF